MNSDHLASKDTWNLSTTAICKANIRYKFRFVNLILSAIIIRCTVYGLCVFEKPDKVLKMLKHSFCWNFYGRNGMSK